MDIFFQDPNDIPLPPEEVRLRELRAEPWRDGRRIKVFLEIEPFQKRPSAEISLTGPSGDEAAHASIIETMARKLELNLHLRGDPAPGVYTLSATLFYQKLPAQDEAGSGEPPAPALVVDQRQVEFTLPVG